jgi:hypothetical protein
MREDKTAFQKMVEKALMLERNSRLRIIIAKGPQGARLIVGYSDSSGSITPLAELLSQAQIDQLEPMFETFEQVNEIFDTVRPDLSAKTPHGMLLFGPHPALSVEAIDELMS